MPQIQIARYAMLLTSATQTFTIQHQWQLADLTLCQCSLRINFSLKQWILKIQITEMMMCQQITEMMCQQMQQLQSPLSSIFFPIIMQLFSNICNCLHAFSNFFPQI